MELQKITSRGNDRLKYGRKVREGRVEGKIFLEGVRLIGEAVRSRTPLDTIFVSSGSRGRLQDLVEVAGARIVYEVADDAFQSLADTTNAQGVIAIAETPSGARDEIGRRLETSTIPVVVFLDRVNNPSNLGAVIRTAEAAGAAGVIVSSGSADAFSPKALRAAMGSSLRLPVWTDVEFDDVIEWAATAGLRTTATDSDATQDYSEVDWAKPRLLVMGSEASGIDEEALRKIKEVVKIPMENMVESLNLAVACGIFLFEAKRQRRER